MTGLCRWLAAISCAALVLAGCSGDDDEPDRAAPTTAPGPTTPLVTTANGEPTRDGDFAEVASGDDGGLQWTLLRAPATGGGICWRLDTEPEVDLVLAASHCNVPLPPGQPRAFVIDFPFATGITTDHDIVVGVVPEEIGEAEFGFSDGSTAEPSYLDREAGIIVWAGPSRPVAAAVELTTPDGVKIGCGPGDVSSALELYDLPEPKLLDARQFVWTCIENV